MQYSRNLLDNVPSYYAELLESSEILCNESAETNEILSRISELTEQITVSTATWGLAEWERLLAIETDLSETDEIRRARILSKIRGAAPTTVTNMMTLLNAYSIKNSARLTEYPREQLIDAEFDVNERLDLRGILTDLRTYIPAHLAYRIATMQRSKPSIRSCGLSGATTTIYPYRIRNITQQSQLDAQVVVTSGQTATIYPK